MLNDTETFSKSKKKQNDKPKRKKYYDEDGDDFPSMVSDMFCGVNWKVALFLYILMVFIFSDVYIELFLNSVSGAVEGDCPTTKGTVMQITMVVMGYIVLDLLVHGGFL